MARYTLFAHASRFPAFHLVHISGCCPRDLSWSRPSRLLDLRACCSRSLRRQVFKGLKGSINNFIATKVDVKHATCAK